MPETEKWADEGTGCEEQCFHCPKVSGEVEHEYTETCEEQEKRYTQHRRQCFNQPRKAQLLRSSAKGRTRLCRTARIGPRPCENVGVVLICPSLQQRTQHNARQTDGHAQKPERVDHYDRLLRLELVGVGEGRGREGIARLGLVVSDEQFVGFHEIENPFVERVQLEASDRCADKCRDCGCEQGSLLCLY